MDLKYKNLILAITVAALMIAGAIGYYFTVDIGAITVGTVGNVGQSTALNLSDTMKGVINDTETDFAGNVSTANSVIPIAFGLLILVAILLIFGFDLGKMFGGSGRGGVE